MITFKRDIYLKNYFSHNQEIIKQINTFIEEQKKTLLLDKRKIIHGHDFEDLLLFYLKITHKNAKETFKKSLYSTLEHATLKKRNNVYKVTQTN
ncbi:MAG: hypothetical protein Q9M39_09890 [Sulfurovum sp.]|nr:hypothetical protein [Sulfurovum sp.]